MTAPDVTAVVLAGGRSRRFGRDKLAEPVAGRSLLDRSIDAVRPLAREIIVVAAVGNARAWPDGVVVVSDSIAYEGPLFGLLTGLRCATQPITLVVAGDMPAMVESVLEAMLTELLDPAIDAVALEHEGRQRPLPAVLRTGPALAAAERLIVAGERRLRAIFVELATRAIDEPTWRALDPTGLTLRDVDVPADLLFTQDAGLVIRPVPAARRPGPLR
jgi:molybdopterin-guanine dinucleotide biosynthesis protein A